MHAEGLQWLRRALAACSAVSDVHVRALFATAVFEARLGRMEEEGPLGRSIADIGRHDEDPLRRAEAAHLHCLLSWLAAEWDTIDRLLDTAEHDLRSVPPVRAAHDHLRALVALSRGDPEAALPRLEDASRWLAETPRGAPPFFSVCTVACSVGRYDGITMPIFEETMLVGRRVGVAQAEAYVLCTRAFADRASGRFSDAAEVLDRSCRYSGPSATWQAKRSPSHNAATCIEHSARPLRRSSASDGQPTSGPPSPTSAAPPCR